MKKYYPDEPVNIHIQSLFCDNGEWVIPIHAWGHPLQMRYDLFIPYTQKI